MNKKQAVFALLFSVFTAGSSFGTVAYAATQTQSQSMLSEQSQEVDTASGSNVSQNQTSAMSATQQQTTNKKSADQQVDNTTSSVGSAVQDHTENGAGDFQQSQNQSAVYTISSSNTNESNQTQTNTKVSSEQSGAIQTTDSTKINQSASSVIQNSESQTAEEQSVVVQNNSTMSGLNSNPSDKSDKSQEYSSELITVPGSTYHNTLQPSLSSNVVAGYAIFDLNGDRLSDLYGIYSNHDNNQTGNYNAFQSDTPTIVIIRPVNADGDPVVNQSAVNLYLTSNNSNGTFLSLGSFQPFDSIELSAGSTGVTVIYVNHSSIPQFDILDVSTVDHHDHHDKSDHTTMIQRPQALNVETDQTQSAKIKDATTNQSTNATESQTVVSSTNQAQTNTAPTNQSEGSSQSTNSTQQQAVITADGSKAGQTENSSVNTTQNTSIDNSHSQSLNVSANQHEEASPEASSPDSTELSQSQSVTVQSPSINVTLSQSHTPTSLDQSIGISMPDTSNLQSTTVVNVNFGDTQKQWTLNTQNPVTFNESQSENTSDGSSYSNSASMDYVIGSTTYHVPIS